jgi:sugar/nucleoside kinase (ribokinase family)
VVDSVGAGDAYLAVTSPCAAAHFPPDVIGFIGTAVGGMAIKILDNEYGALLSNTFPILSLLGFKFSGKISL